MLKHLFLTAVFFLTFVLSDYSYGQTVRSQVLYTRTDADSIAKGLWALGNLDPKNNSYIDHYLMVTECALYQQFFKNDLEWGRIRDATRAYITANKQYFPKRFEFIQPIILERWDETKGGFPLSRRTALVSLKKIQISGNDPKKSVCLDTSAYNQNILPINAILNFARPVTYSFVKVPPNVVNEYLAYLEKKKIKSESNRPAYIRYRVKAEQSIGVIQSGQLSYANFYGKIESITIFGDKELFIKLDEVKF